MKRYLIYIFLVLIISSCNNRNTREFEEKNLVSEIFIIDDELTAPSGLVNTRDGLLVRNSDIADTIVEYFDNNGKFISKFIKKGSGPNELLRSKNVQYNEYDNSIYICDSKRNLIYKISLSNNDVNPNMELVQSLGHTEGENVIDVNNEKVLITGNIGVLNSGKIVATNGTQSGMIGIFDNEGNVENVIVPYPSKSLVDEKLTDWANINLYYPWLRVSPNGKFAVSMYHTADIRIFMNDTSDSIDYKVFKDAYPNDIFIIESGDSFVQGAMTKKSKTYTLDVTLSNNHAYQLYLGESDEDYRESEYYKDTKKSGSNVVNVYDKNGRLSAKLNLDKYVESISVDPEEKYLYAITESSEEGYTILRYEL